MRFSVRVQYGLQAMLELARRANSGPVRANEIALDQRIPIRFLEQVLLFLRRRNLVKSFRGKEGGYRIARHPAEISLLEIIETLDGPVDLVGKKLKRSAALSEAFEKLQKALRNHLAEITLEDIILRLRQKEMTFSYTI
jgi:Rrf2 family protein